MAESFFASLKNEFVHRTVFPKRNKTVSNIAYWIGVWYKLSGLHSGSGYHSPCRLANNTHLPEITLTLIS